MSFKLEIDIYFLTFFYLFELETHTIIQSLNKPILTILDVLNTVYRGIERLGDSFYKKKNHSEFAKPKNHTHCRRKKLLGYKQIDRGDMNISANSSHARFISN